MSSSSTLPPPGNLPSWSRVSALDRTRYPKPFLRDRIPLPPGGGTTITTDTMIDFGNGLGNVDVKFLEGMANAEQKSMVRYNKSVAFLQQQHADTLKKLHEEIDKLKKENKELQFNVIVTHSGGAAPTKLPPKYETQMQTAGVAGTSSPAEHVKMIDMQALLLQEEVKELRKALVESNIRNEHLQQTVLLLQQHKMPDGSKVNFSPDSINRSPKLAAEGERVFRHRRKYSVSSLSSPLPLNATLNPLQVRDSPDEDSRVPTLPECEHIIQQLHETNCQQLAELSRLRMEARDGLFSRNTTPEPYQMKTYGGTDHESFSDTRLPRIPVKPILKKSIASADSLERVVTLPALKNSITTNVADRRKRQQAVQRARSKKDFQ